MPRALRVLCLTKGMEQRYFANSLGFPGPHPAAVLMIVRSGARWILDELKPLF